MTKSKKTIILISLFILLTVIDISAKSRKNDEKRFQMGFGFTASSASLFNFIQSIKMSSSGDYSVLTVDGTDTNMTSATKQTMITANMLAAMEIGFQIRFLAHVFFSELDFIGEPLTGISSGHCDLMLMYDIGLRCPKWIMPYFAAGINGTFGLYPDNVSDVLGWATSLNNGSYVNNNLMITFGVHAKFGLDVKFKRFSVGCYCMWLVKDVINDWTDALPNYYKNLSIASDDPDVNGTLLFIASQFRVGASVCWYAF